MCVILRSRVLLDPGLQKGPRKDTTHRASLYHDQQDDIAQYMPENRKSRYNVRSRLVCGGVGRGLVRGLKRHEEVLSLCIFMFARR